MAILIGCLATACSGKDKAVDKLDQDAEIQALSEPDMRTLCRAFVADACKGIPEAPMCKKECAGLCDGDQLPSVVKASCPAPIKVKNARECSRAAAEKGMEAQQICIDGKGGCLFDVSDDLCKS